MALGAMRAAESVPAILDRASEVRALSASAAAEGRPVQLRGNLLLVTVPRNAVVLQDGTDGIYVELPDVVNPQFRLGDVLEVTGTTGAGDFAPIVRASQVTRIGAGSLPVPRPSTIAELNAGGRDAAWVELRGIVRSCVPTPAERMPLARGAVGGTPTPGGQSGMPPTWLITFAQGDDKTEALVNGPLVPERLIDAEVRLRAVVFNVHNANRQFVRANLQVPNSAQIEVTVPPPSDPFALPLQALGEVLRFAPTGFTGHRIHVRGVVTAHKDRHTLWLIENGRGMQVASAQEGDLLPGDVVEVVGFPDHGSYTPRLSDAIFRKVTSGPVPVAQLLRGPEDIALNDSSLVQIRAEVREVKAVGDGRVLVLGWQGLEVRAQLLHSGEAPGSPPPEPGAFVLVTGICQAGQTNYLRPTGRWVADDLQLWMRTPADLVVLRPAPWLTTGRALWLALIVIAVTLLALVVLAINARRQIAQREDARKLAEVEFSAMLAERNRLARELHDTLAQELNAISMQLELAKNAAKSGAAGSAMPFLTAAHEIVRQCLAEARESIWDMRSHILEKQDLAGALRSVAEQLRGGGACEIRSTTRGTPRRLAPAVENNLLRIGQEAVSNALKHARPNFVEVALDYEPMGARLVVTNDGEAFDPAWVEGTNRHFGLRGMRERVAQMNGQLHVGRDEAGRTKVEVCVATPEAV